MKDKILLGLIALMIIGFVSSSFGSGITGEAVSNFPGWANCKDVLIKMVLIDNVVMV